LRKQSRQADIPPKANSSGQESGGYSMATEKVTVPRSLIEDVIRKIDEVIDKLPKE